MTACAGGKSGDYLRRGLMALALLFAYYLAGRFSMSFTSSPDGIAVIWLPNAFLLFFLLYNRGRHYWMLPLTVLAEIAADLPVFHWYEATVMSAVNIAEATLAYGLLRRMGVAQLQRLEDHVRFLLAGPVFGALAGGILGAAVIKYLHGGTESYLSLVRIWWFGDALGLLIATPLLLNLTQPGALKAFVGRGEHLAGLAVAMLAIAAYGVLSLIYKDILLTPAVLLPPILYAANRLGSGFTTVAVALVSLALAAMVIAGVQMFGEEKLNVSILHVQELIFTMSIMSLGFAVLMAEIRQHKRQLEQRVVERTRELAEANERLAVMAQTDVLTGLLNRRAIFESAAQDLDRCLRYGRPLAIIMMDIDLFKSVNDRYGHQAGDAVLHHIGRTLLESLRASDKPGRYGGEEFIVVAPETDEEMARELAERLREIFAAEAIEAEGHRIPITVSIGFSLMRQGDDLSQVVRRADEALYQAKRNGRNRVEQA